MLVQVERNPYQASSQGSVNWQVSPEWAAHIRLIGVIHVTKGTWQPILQLEDPYRFYA
jgi:hypothetical protein